MNQLHKIPALCILTIPFFASVTLTMVECSVLPSSRCFREHRLSSFVSKRHNWMVLQLYNEGRTGRVIVSCGRTANITCVYQIWISWKHIVRCKQTTRKLLPRLRDWGRHEPHWIFRTNLNRLEYHGDPHENRHERQCGQGTCKSRQCCSRLSAPVHAFRSCINGVRGGSSQRHDADRGAPLLASFNESCFRREVGPTIEISLENVLLTKPDARSRCFGTNFS